MDGMSSSKVDPCEVCSLRVKAPVTQLCVYDVCIIIMK